MKLKSLLGFSALMLLIGVGQSFALKCTGTIRVQKPSTWATMYYSVNGGFTAIPATSLENGWYVINAASMGDNNAATFFFAAESDNWNGEGISKLGFATTTLNDHQKEDVVFTCADLDAGDLYISENPAAPGQTVYSNAPPDAKYLHVLFPEDDKWLSGLPMISLDGTVASAKMMNADPDRCGWYTYVWFNTEITDEVLIVRDDITDATLEEAKSNGDGVIGFGGLGADQFQALPLNTLFSMLGNELYFIPDEANWETPELEASQGWLSADPGLDVTGTCGYGLAAVIYDSDASLHPAFSCDDYLEKGGCYYNHTAGGITSAQAAIYAESCIGVTTGIVNPVLDPNTKKPTLSATGARCFINDSWFNMLFTKTPNVNELTCTDMPFTRADDGLWEFNSDDYTSPGAPVKGGFYPVENTTLEKLLEADPTQTTELLAARTKRTAEGPIYYGPYLRENDPGEGSPRIDVMCNGPGWAGGVNCEGYFADGDGTQAAVQTALRMPANNNCVFGWSCPDKQPKGWATYRDGTETPMAGQGAAVRWTSRASTGGGRNQQFCFESHANFIYKPGLKFTFRGDDDIWIYIDNKLAVDIGGTHLAAPGYVDLDVFGPANGLVYGTEYDLDIFFCDRRTTMSNVRIKTNIFMQQKTGIKASENKIPGSSEVQLGICYTESGGGGCAAALSGRSETKEYCGEELVAKGLPIVYIVTKANGDIVRVIDDIAPGTLNAGTYLGGINLSNVTMPVVDREKMQGLGPGRYQLWIAIGGEKQRVYTWRVSGEVDIATRSAIAVDSNGTVIPGANYPFVSEAMGGELVPLYISSISDPCDGAACSDPLEFDVVSAVGQSYTLDVPAGLSVYTKLEDGSFDPIPSGTARNIGESGVDTVYIMAPLNGMTAKTQTFAVGVLNRPNKAQVTYYAPVLYFVDSPDSAFSIVGGDPDTLEHWVGNIINFYMAAMKEEGNGQVSLCETCNFEAIKGDFTSLGLTIVSDLNFVNGRLTVSVRADKEFRYDPVNDNPAMLHITGSNPELMQAVYTPIHFKDPPFPVPSYVELFDVKGAPLANINVPDPYFNEAQEYLDGIADSIVIYYKRPFYDHVDSIPDSIYVAWDTEFIVNRDNSHTPMDSLMLITKDKEEIRQAILAAGPDPKGDNYYKPILKFGGKNLANKVKTGGAGQIVSWAHYVDKGRELDGYGTGVITDRMAPVITSATVKAAATEGFDQLMLTFSEALTYEDAFGTESFTFYLNSNTREGEDRRLRNSVAARPPNKYVDTVNVTYNNTTQETNPTPHVGDYIRFRADELIWRDTVLVIEMDSITQANYISDGTPWNSPTDYIATGRLPSPWVLVDGAAELGVTEITFGHVDDTKIDNPAIEVFGVETHANTSKDSLAARFPGTLGHFVQANLGNLIMINEDEKHPIDPANVYFEYEVSYFTNLGGYVASQKGKINCTDEMFNGDCTNASNQRNFYIAWNMKSDEGRFVGSGAYIVKLNSHVVLDKLGKKAKEESTSVWGVSRAKKK